MGGSESSTVGSNWPSGAQASHIVLGFGSSSNFGLLTDEQVFGTGYASEEASTRQPGS